MHWHLYLLTPKQQHHQKNPTKIPKHQRNPAPNYHIFRIENNSDYSSLFSFPFVLKRSRSTFHRLYIVTWRCFQTLENLHFFGKQCIVCCITEQECFNTVKCKLVNLLKIWFSSRNCLNLSPVSVTQDISPSQVTK